MKNRNFANRTLLCVFLLYIAVVVLKVLFGKNFYSDWAMFVLEASLVGGIADWFAVTALFKRPLGLPLKATAVIPNNREKVIDAVCDMVENDLFTADGILEKVENTDTAAALIGYIDENDLIDLWCSRVLARLADLSAEGESRQLIPELGEGIKKGLSGLSLSAGVNKIMHLLVSAEENAQVSGFLFDTAIRVVKTPEVRAEITRSLNGAVDNRIGQMKENVGLFARILYSVASIADCVNVNEAAASLQSSLCETFEAMKKPENPVRAQFDTLLLDYAQKLETNQEWKGLIERYKEELIHNLPVAQELGKLLRAICGTKKSSEEDSLPEIQGFREDRIKFRVRRLWDSVKESEIFRHETDTLIKSLIFDFVRSENKAIGELVRDALNGFSNEKLSDFVQQKVGDDLAWIRVNGSFVGGLVGAVLYLLLNLAYLPLLHTLK